MSSRSVDHVDQEVADRPVAAATATSARPPSAYGARSSTEPGSSSATSSIPSARNVSPAARSISTSAASSSRRAGRPHAASVAERQPDARALRRRSVPPRSETLVASWEAYARGSHGAAVIRSPGVATAVFPNEPERGVYNNALLERGLGPRARAARWTRWRPPTPRPASTASPPGCTRATGRCARELERARLHARRVDARDGHGARRHPAAAAGARARAAGLVRVSAHLVGLDCRRACSPAPIPERSTSWSRASTARTWRRRSRSTSTATAGSTTSSTLEPARRRGLGTALTRCSCTTPPRAAAGRRACSRRRWPSGSTPPSASATSDGSSNTFRSSTPVVDRTTGQPQQTVVTLRAVAGQWG